jgi:hypothetical protein
MKNQEGKNNSQKISLLIDPHIVKENSIKIICMME